jgi:hypothetical protein
MHLPELAEGVRQQGLLALINLPGISMLEVLAVMAAATALRKSPEGCDPAAAGSAGWLAAALLLVPSSNLAALVILALGCGVGLRSSGPARWACLGLAGLGLNFIYLHHGLALQAWIIEREAWAAHAVLSCIIPGLVRDGITLHASEGHAIAILSGCSIGQTIPVAIIALVVMLRTSAPAVPPGRMAAWLGLMLIALALANVLRLAALAGSATSYAWVHGPLGANLFGLACGLGVQGCAALAARRG